MAYTQPTAKTAGDPTLASDWNNYVKDNFIALRALLPDPGASNLPLVSSSTSAAAFGQLGTAGIATGAITADRLAAGAVGAAALAATSVGSAAIAANAVTTAKLDQTVNSEAVTTATIRALAVTTAKLATASGAEAVSTATIQAGAVTTAKLAANAVGRAALADVVQPLIGAVVAYAATGAPTGWLVCNGQAVSRTTYSALFGIVSTTYGSGNGSTTFNVPNLQDRFIQGSGTTYALNATGGDATHSHSVTLDFGTTSEGPSENRFIYGNSSGNGTEWSVPKTNHTHDVPISTTRTSSSNQVLPPYRALNYLIYAGA